MKNRIFANIRFKIMFYSLISIVIAILVDLLVVGGLYFGVQSALNGQRKEQKMRMEETGSSYLTNQTLVQQQVQQQQSGNQVLVLICILCGIVLGIVIFMLVFQMFTKEISKNLERISDGIAEISAGNLEKEIQVSGRDEFAVIAGKLNVMTGEIRMLLDNERQYEREKDALITNVAHDLRTPLTSIIGYLDLVRLKPDLDAESRTRYISVAYEGAKRLEKLVEDLFEFTKVGAERMQLHPMKLDFGRFLEQMVEEFYPSFESAQLVCKMELNLTDGMIEADGDLLARGIGNLFSNAVKYGRDGKLLKVYAREDLEEQKMFLSITNFGKIISPEDLEHIFDKFFRGEASRSTETGGSGLGLAIAKKVVLLHHGQIAVSSDYNGTVFSIVLPLKQS